MVAVTNLELAREAGLRDATVDVAILKLKQAAARLSKAREKSSAPEKAKKISDIRTGGASREEAEFIAKHFPVGA